MLKSLCFKPCTSSPVLASRTTKLVSTRSLFNFSTKPPCEVEETCAPGACPESWASEGCAPGIASASAATPAPILCAQPVIQFLPPRISGYPRSRLPGIPLTPLKPESRRKLERPHRSRRCYLPKGRRSYTGIHSGVLHCVKYIVCRRAYFHAAVIAQLHCL